MADDSATTTPAEGNPADQLLIVEVGKKQARKRVKQLREGRGKLFDEVQDALEQLRTEGAIGANAQPVVIVVREKSRSLPRMPW